MASTPELSLSGRFFNPYSAGEEMQQSQGCDSPEASQKGNSESRIFTLNAYGVPPPCAEKRSGTLKWGRPRKSRGGGGRVFRQGRTGRGAGWKGALVGTLVWSQRFALSSLPRVQGPPSQTWDRCALALCLQGCPTAQTLGRGADMEWH